jgi:hypothetical protein
VHTRDKQNGHIGQDLADQLRQMKRQLDHNMITLDTLKDQLSNLINLVWPSIDHSIVETLI